MLRLAFFSVFRASCEFAPSQLARLRCSNTLAYRFSSERETTRSLSESAEKGASASTTRAANEFAYFQTLSRLFNSLKMSNVDEFPLEFISWGPHLSWERTGNKNSSSLVNRETKHFHVVVVRWRNGNVPKSVMHVHACASGSRNKRNVASYWLQSLTGFKLCAATPKEHGTVQTWNEESSRSSRTTVKKCTKKRDARAKMLPLSPRG